MSQPTGEQSQDGQGSGGSGRSSSSKAPKVSVLTVGQFTVRDDYLGRDHTGIAVVVETGDALIVRPLAEHYVQVDPADFVPLAADDV